jgi:transcriptional regulator with GAF, ATPase, and Fis domain
MSAKGTRSYVRDPGVEVLPQRDEVVGLSVSLYPAFEDLLCDLCSVLSTCAADDLESVVARRLDQLALQLGAERCTVGAFSDVAHAGIHMQWLVGKAPTPSIGSENSWIQKVLAGGQSISISTLDELPVEALSTRQELEEIGVRSGLWVPIMAEGSVVGGIGLTVMSHEQDWPAPVIQQCQNLGRTIGNALLRRRRVTEIEERSQFEALITDFSTRCMNIDADIDAITDGVLGELGEFLGTDRVSFLEVNAKEKSLVPTWQWFAQGVEQDRSVQNVDVSARFPWLIEKIIKNEPVRIDDMDQFPDEATNERQYCENLGIRAFTMVPAMLGGKVVAALALDNLNLPQIWTDGIVRRLQIVTGMIASAQDRARRQREIEVLRRFERALSDISTAFVNLTPEKVDDQIETGLAKAGQALNVDLVTLLQPSGEVDSVVTHEWATDVFKAAQFKGTRVVQAFPWLAVRLRQNQTIAISELSDFPAEAKSEVAAMESAGLESVLWVPFEVRGQLAGHLCINTIKQRKWSEELVPKLQLLGEVFGAALNRRDSEIELRKSFDEIESLKERLQQENLYLREKTEPSHSYGEIIGDSASLRAALTKVEQVAPTDSTVLILGETGTGKELLARAIHENSPRKSKVMVVVNCAALPSSLVEAELFGREKGAYTGALTQESGRFEIADGSTILLDEIGELSLELQAKLLRVLQDGEFERLGSSKTRKVDVRVLAATNRDLDRAVEKKEFREDLFYRLNVFPIEVPPLRDRAEDIPQLVWAFVQEFSETMGKSIESIPTTAMDALKEYGWPGNVREVRNIIERAMIVSKGPILKIDLQEKTVAAAGSRQLADVEREHIQAVVQATGWRIRGAGGAAEILGLKATTLEARMKKLGLQRGQHAVTSYTAD